MRRIRCVLSWRERRRKIILGLILLGVSSLAFWGPKTPWALLGLVGLFPLIAGITGY
ncbi:DUF2892 domain-containing protein [Ammonifex degensii]|uniref:DUF2892 domain-containing protein n=1 Tax=Ammonifex degensii TaxID=42838 RepID=UPI0012EA389B|nr:DUF2892 domain-containing protein [Ammonifex degensii]